MSLGTNVKRMLKEKGVTAIELADFCSVDQSMISKIVKDVKTPSIGLLVCMADFFGCTVDDLIKGRDIA